MPVPYYLRTIYVSDRDYNLVVIVVPGPNIKADIRAGTTVYGLKLIIVKHMEQSVLDGGLGDYVFDYAFCICVSCQKDF